MVEMHLLIRTVDTMVLLWARTRTNNAQMVVSSTKTRIISPMAKTITKATVTKGNKTAENGPGNKIILFSVHIRHFLNYVSTSFVVIKLYFYKI